MSRFEFHDGSRLFLLLLLLVPLIWWRYFRPARRSAVMFSSIAPLDRAPSLSLRLRHTIPILRTLAVTLLIICLARPQKGNEQTRIFAEGVAIQLLVDRSGSMRAMDFHVDGRPVDRLMAVKKVVREFVLGEGELPGRPDDLIGLIVFGTYADSLCPLTLDHDHLLKSLKEAEIAETNEESATAIGDALALAVERLRAIEAQRDLDPTLKIKSKIIILLTDGENTAGDIDPLQAAELAATFDIKVYTIGAGTSGMAPVPATDVFGRQIIRAVPVTIDEETLKRIAEITKAHYFRATDLEALQKVYARIDELEKSKIEQRRFSQYKELATAQVQWGSVTIPPLLLIVLLLLALEIILANTRFQKIP